MIVIKHLSKVFSIDNPPNGKTHLFCDDVPLILFCSQVNMSMCDDEEEDEKVLDLLYVVNYVVKRNVFLMFYFFHV